MNAAAAAMMLGLVQLLVGFVVSWEALEFVLRYGLLLSTLKLLLLAAAAAAASCVAVLYALSLLLFSFLGIFLLSK